uniref:Uncharacterized protein n=1 Tax=Arundo donax TaxID=35708 RepID=A0A0A9EMS6_ARUDO
MFIGRGAEVESYQQYSTVEDVDPYDQIYHNLPSHHHFLEQVPNCRHCNAKRF